MRAEWSPGAAGPVLSLLAPPAWQDRALCAEVDPELFFPEPGGSTGEAKRVCMACEVRAECLEFALETGDQFGIYGGLSPTERRRLPRPARKREDWRTCTGCGVTKPLGEFHRRARGGHEQRCKACRCGAQRQRRAARAA